jgi:hypothetical protein
MVEVAAQRVLSAWESAAQARGHRRALALLALASDADAADMPLGQRDALLLRLFGDVRGPQLDALAACPACSTTLELRLAIADLVDGYPCELGHRDMQDVDLGAVRVRARCPTTADLIAAGGEAGIERAREVLVSRCVSDVRRDGDDACGELDDDELRRLGEHIERIDPLADVRIDIGCDECGHRWSALLDVPVLVWAQVEGAARRVLREVDALAARYGWSQAEILGMSQARRHAYLDLP